MAVQACCKHWVQHFMMMKQIVDMRKGAYLIKYIRRIDLSGVHPQLTKVNIQLMSDFSSRLYGKKVKSCKHTNH